MAANLDILIRAQNQASSALRAVGGDLDNLSNKAGVASRGFSGLQSVMGAGLKAAAGVAVAGVAALGVGLVKSVNAAADFESQINILGVAASASGTSMADLSAAALQVGADSKLVGISASEAADAMTNFYKAGLDTSEIFADLNGYLGGTAELSGALRSAVDLAAASELDLAAASDVVAVAMATFGLEATDASRIANVLVGAADASIASVSGLADGLKNVGPLAASMGISLEDVSTSLAILSTRGIQGSEAGTALRSMLVNLQRPTKAVTETLDALGVSLYDSAGNMKTMPDVIGQLEGAMAGLTDEQRNQVAMTLAGTYGLSALNILVGEGTAGWNTMSTAIGAAATAQEVAAARTRGFRAAMEQLRGGLETFMITVGTPLIQEFLTPAAQAITRVIERMTSMAPSVEQVRAAYDNLIGRGAALLKHVREIAGPIMSVIGSFVSWKDVLIALGIVVASMVIPVLIGIVAAAAPVILVAAALVAGVALLRNAWERDWGGIQGITKRMGEMLVSWFGTISTWMRDRLPSAINTVVGALGTFWGWIDKARGGDFGPLMAGLESVFKNVIEWGRESVSKLWGVISDAIGTIKIRVADWFTSIDWGGILATIGGMAVAFGTWVAGWLGKIEWPSMADIKAFGVWVTGWLGDVAWPVIAETFQKFTTWVTGWLGDVDWPTVNDLISFADWVWTWLGTVAWPTIKGTIKTFSTWVSSWLGTIKWPTVADFLAFGAWVKSWLGTVAWPAISENFKAFTAWVSSFVGSISWPAIAETFRTFSAWVSSWLGKIEWPTVEDILSFAEWVKSWIGDIAWPAIKGTLTSFSTWVRSWLPEIKWPTIKFAEPTFDITPVAIPMPTFDFSLWSWTSVTNGIRDGLIAAATAGVDSVDWSRFSTGLARGISTAAADLSGVDFSGMGASLKNSLLGWSWKASLGIFAAALSPALTASILTYRWIFSSDLWGGFATSVKTALKNINWSDLGSSLDALKESVAESLAEFVSGFLGIDNQGFTLGLEKLLAWEWPTIPEAITILVTTFDWPSIGKWFQSLMDYKWPDLTWLKTLTDFSWPDLEWLSSLLDFSWPALLWLERLIAFTWPGLAWLQTLLDFTWPSITMPSFSWPSLPTWHWPVIPTPTWLASLLAALGGNKSNAAGTSFFSGGMTMVGERGPELVVLPRGSRVLNSEQTARSGQGSINVTINANVTDGMDLESLAYRIASMIQQKQRGGALGYA